MISTLKLFSILILSVVLTASEYADAFHQPPRQLQEVRVASSIALNMAAPATIEREKTVKRTVSSPAVQERRSSEKVPAKERNQEGGEAWEVRIYNDGMNTREHVARALVQITGMAEMTAYQTMMTAHQNGIASVGMFCFEIAEMYNDGLRKEGIVSDIIPVDEELQ
jgi:ATP-dependent Clp protease adapter protein ClpS